MPPAKPGTFRFGLFEADFEQLTLKKAGTTIKLQDQPFRVLEILVARAGEVVTRTEIGQKLWSEDTFVEFDDGLNTVIRKLRIALGDDSDNPRFIETVPRKGYRFIAPVEHHGPAQESLPPVPLATASVSSFLPPPSVVEGVAAKQPKENRRLTKTPWLWLAGAIVVLAAAVGVWRWRLSPPAASAQIPKSVRITPLTRSGAVHPNQNLATDGLRIYYIERMNGDWTLKSMPATGGIGTRLDVTLPRFDLQDVSPDSSLMLLRLLSTDADNASLWTIPTAGGPVHRVGDTRSEAAAFTSDGRGISFADLNEPGHVFLCDKDGRNLRQMFSVQGEVLRIRWSPAGDVVRFTVNNSLLHTNAIWEIRADGTDLHPLLPQWNPLHWEWAISWSHDAHWFAFSSVHEAGKDIWIMQHNPSSTAPDRGPFQLTSGPLDFDLPLFSGDGKRLYTVGAQHRGELLRFNPKTQLFDPYLQGISADQLDFSRDGKWVVYVTYPDSVLWRARSDGSQATKLNDSTRRVMKPKWSPDGRQIAFLARVTQGARWQAFVISSDGGVAHEVTSQAIETNGIGWEADGKALILSSPQWDQLRTLDLATRSMMNVTGSEHLQEVFVSPSGRFLIGSTDEGEDLEILDRDTGTRREFGVKGDCPSWTSDERNIYFNRFKDSNPALYRVSPTDLKEEKIFNLNQFAAAGGWSQWSSVAPDGSLLMLRDLGGADIYAIDWKVN